VELGLGVPDPPLGAFASVPVVSVRSARVGSARQSGSWRVNGELAKTNFERGRRGLGISKTLKTS
jgi:hypothetical protein